MVGTVYLDISFVFLLRQFQSRACSVTKKYLRCRIIHHNFVLDPTKYIMPMNLSFLK